MNQELKQFSGFILERVKQEKIEEAKELLGANLKKLEEGNFTRDDFAEVMPKMKALLKPDKVGEVQAIMQLYAQKFNR